MAEATIAYADLSEQAQQAAIANFIPAYIDQFRRDNLEVLDEDYASGDIPMINHVLYSGARFDKAELVTYLTERVLPHFDHLLSVLPQTYLANGTPQQAWPQWFEAQRLQLENGQ